MPFDLDAIGSRRGEVAIVTGANSGVGFEVSVGLAQKAIKVIMACRNLKKAESAKQEIRARVPDADLEVIQLDLSHPESVHAFARQFTERYDALNLLINNAGVLFRTPTMSSAGVEMQFATNHLGHFLLTSLLIDLMPDVRTSRVVSLSSLAHKKAKIFFDDINCELQTKWDVPYAQSKLACLLFADELQRKLKLAGKKILSVAAHPGGTDSGLFDHMPKFVLTVLRYTFVPIFLHSNERAAKPVLMAALAGGLQGGEYLGPTGLFEMKGPPGTATRTTYSQREDIGARLWELSERFTETSFKIQL